MDADKFHYSLSPELEQLGATITSAWFVEQTRVMSAEILVSDPSQEPAVIALLARYRREHAYEFDVKYDLIEEQAELAEA